MRASITLAIVLIASPVLAQPDDGRRGSSPYAGLEARPIKALSDKDVDDLRNGRGMGLALPAELNGYPGPSHVVELSADLRLSDAQRARMGELFAAMKAETIPLGERLLVGEQDLDALFASKIVTPATLEAASSAIAKTQGALRAAHLRYHLLTVAELTSEQVRRYRELRGYAASAARSHGARHHP